MSLLIINVAKCLLSVISLTSLDGWFIKFYNLLLLSSTDQFVTSDHMSVVAHCCSNKWLAMGRVLLECDNNEVLDVVSGLPQTATAN